jgi:hypothetical protein
MTGEGDALLQLVTIPIYDPPDLKFSKRGSSRSGLFGGRSSVLCLNVRDR